MTSDAICSSPCQVPSKESRNQETGDGLVDRSFRFAQHSNYAKCYVTHAGAFLWLDLSRIWLPL